MSNSNFFEIIRIPDGVGETIEQLGTKTKFWYKDSVHGPCLFKEGRPGTGENWAEKIACELAQLLDLPHAHCELAEHRGQKGTVSINLAQNDARLVHGNELLSKYSSDATTHPTKPYHNREHTLRRVVAYFKANAAVSAPLPFQKTEEIQTALAVFIGYLMFDSWIANQDRHAHNWGILRESDGNNYLASTFDHGSSMGRNESDKKREAMMTSNDQGQQIPHYANKARSALYLHKTDTKAIKTIDAFKNAAQYDPLAARAWIHRLKIIDSKKIEAIFKKIPPEWMSDTSKKFTHQLLDFNCHKIIELESTL